MKKLKTAAFIDGAVLLLLIMMAIAINSKEAYGLAALEALSEFVFCFLLGCGASAILVIILFLMLILCALQTNCANIKKPLNVMLFLKLLQLLVCLSIAIFATYSDTKTYAEVLGHLSDNWDIFYTFICNFLFLCIAFCIIGFFTSLLFVIIFLKSGIKKAAALLLWLATILPIIDIAVIAALRYQPKKSPAGNNEKEAIGSKG